MHGGKYKDRFVTMDWPKYDDVEQKYMSLGKTYAATVYQMFMYSLLLAVLETRFYKVLMCFSPLKA